MKWEPQYTLCSFPNMTVIRKGKKAVCEISINVYDSESNFQVALHLSGNEVETIEIDLDSFEVRRSQVDVPTLFLLKQVLGVRLIQNAEEICSIVMKEDQIDIFKKAITEAKYQKRCFLTYHRATGLSTSASTIADAETAFALLSTITGYRDAEKKITEVQDQIIRFKEDIYQQGIKLLSEAKVSSEAEEALNMFISLEDYKDSLKQAELCRLRLLELDSTEQEYQSALSKMARMKTLSEVEEVISLFTSIQYYKDSVQLVSECEAKKLELLEADYLLGCEYFNQVAYPEEVAKPLGIFVNLGGFRDSETKVKECQALRIQLEEKEAFYQETLLLSQSAQTIQQCEECL